MGTAAGRDRGAYDMPYAAMGYAGSSRRAMAPGSSNPCQPRPPTPCLTHALPPLVRGGDGGWRRACNVGMMADMVGIEGRTYADPRYDAGMRSLTSLPPPDPTLTPHAGDQVGWVGGGGRERRGEDGDE